ncbi:MAG: beta strand repeat-containing protein [Isosphaeraceae bacterium]
MLGNNEQPAARRNGKRKPGRPRGRAAGRIPVPPARPSGRTAVRFLDYEILETRRLLSGDLTSDIGQLLSNGQTTSPVDLGTVSLGNDISFNNVTVSFPGGLTQSGSDWTGTVSVSATSASLAIGSDVSAQISGQGTAPGIAGSYTLTNQPAGQGAYQLSASQFDLTLANLLTAQASNIAIDYSPTAAPGQKLVQVGSLSATLLPFDNTAVTVDNLDILDNGFTLGDGTITAPPITLGNVLSIDQPSLTLTDVGYTSGAWTGTIGLNAATASLFPGQSDFSATVDAPAGSYSLASQTLTLSAGNLDVSVGHVLQATGSKLSFSLDDSQSPPAATFDAQSITLTSPDFPNATGTIADFSGTNTGFAIGSASLTGASAVTFSHVLMLSSPTLSVSNFSYTAGAASPVNGTIQIGGTVELFPGQTSFSTTVSGFSASYDIGAAAFDLQASSLELDLGKVLKATTGPLSFAFDDSSGTPAVSFDVKNVSVTSPDFPGVTGTISDLSASNAGFSVASATLSDSSAVSFGKILEVSDPSLSLTDFAYTPGAATPVTGTFTVGGTLELFPGQTSFSTTVSGFSASYDIGAAMFDLQATSIELDLGKVVTATTGAVNFTFDDSSGTPTVSFDVKNVALTSTDFPQATGSIGELTADDTGFSIASASLGYSGSITLGGVLSITGLSLGVENFSYTAGQAGAAPTVGGTITFGAQSISLFPGQSDFTTTISDPTGISPSGLSGSYDINNQALNLQLDQVQVQVGDLLDVTASNVSVDVTPGAFGLTVGSATASVPKLSGLQGSVQNLAITSDGFSIGTATLGFTGTIKLGSVLTITNPSASISGLSYSISQGAQFSGDVGFGLSASLNVGGVASASVTGLEVTLGLTPQDYGQFLVTASSASFALGNYLSLTATGTSSTPLEFNTAPGSGQDIVQFGTVTAKLDAGPLSVSATGQDFAIDANGNFVALAGFGIAASASAAGGINAANAFQWPTFLPIQVSSLALSWPDFNADPSNFSVEISAGINASLAGLTLSGSVQDAVLNVQDIVNGQFPLTSLKGAGFQVGGTFAGVTFNAEGFLATTAGSNGQTILYGGIDGGVDIAGLAGFQIMLGISSLGPLDVYAMVDAPIILDPDTGLALTDLSAGVNFGGGITPPTSAKDLGAATQGVFARGPIRRAC